MLIGRRTTSRDWRDVQLRHMRCHVNSISSSIFITSRSLIKAGRGSFLPSDAGSSAVPLECCSWAVSVRFSLGGSEFRLVTSDYIAGMEVAKLVP